MPSYEANSKFSSDFSSYEFQTTSSDSFLAPEDIVSQSGPTWHGTAIAWHASFSSNMKTIPIVSTRFSGVIFEVKELKIVAYTVYLPTSGQDDDFLEEITAFSHDLSENSNSDTAIVIGIDANTSKRSSKRRQEAFEQFKNEFSLETILAGDKPTFHHNNGLSESQIDFILTNKKALFTSCDQLCTKDEPQNLSSHDALVGNIKIPKQVEINDADYSDTYEAFLPKKIIWKENPIYQEQTAEILNHLLSTFNEPEHLPALAEMSSNMIALCAEKHFDAKKTRTSHKKESPRFSRELQAAYYLHKRNCKEWRKAGRPSSSNHPSKEAKLSSQRLIQKLARDEEANLAKSNHENLMNTHKDDISNVCKTLKRIRGQGFKPPIIPEIETFSGCFRGENVLEGFRYNTEYLCNEKDDKNFKVDFLNRCIEDLTIINDVSKHEDLKIAPMKLDDIKVIVNKKLKNNKACDIYHLTPEHLKHAGDEALEALCNLINRVLENLEFLAAPEFKMAVASVIHKGKGKPKTHHKSFRLVRICPLIGRIIDEYIRPLAVQISKPLQSINQYGFTENITYLMGALQRHEAQKHCIDNKKTFFGCSLDGDSAFEVVCRTIQKRELYFAGETGQLAQYNQSSYDNTKTRIKMKGKVSKPLTEELGVGQGKIRSSDHYKIYINPVLDILDSAQLGIDIGPINAGVSCVADDVYLTTDDQTKLQGLLDIAQHYGQSYRVEYGAKKTVISVVGSKKDMQYYQDIRPWIMDNTQVSVNEDNDHLGLIVSGLREENKNIDLKIKKARGCLFKLLGPAFSFKCLLSPAVQVHLFRIYVCPVARSGLSAMTLRDNHLDSLSMFHRKILRGFLHLSNRSPIPALFFLTGELPIVARLHRDVFSLFYNIWINPHTKIFSITKYLLENAPITSHTWARHIRYLSCMYGLEDPAELIQKTPPSKSEFSINVMTKITALHEKKLRIAASDNSKMTYLNVGVKGLNSKLHPALQGIVTTQCVKKSRSHIKMLTQDLYTYEQKSRYQGGSPHCRLCIDSSQQVQYCENITHILTQCSKYSEVRNRILFQMEIICLRAQSDINFKLIISDKQQLSQFILDCTSLNLPNRISEKDEICPSIFRLSRDLCHSILKTRTDLIRKLK